MQGDGLQLPLRLLDALLTERAGRRFVVEAFGDHCVERRQAMQLMPGLNVGG